MTYNETNICDALYCIDVLGHLENSAESFFIKKIHPLIRIKGILYLKAPWRGQLTHIDAVADNFI